VLLGLLCLAAACLGLAFGPAPLQLWVRRGALLYAAAAGIVWVGGWLAGISAGVLAR
jgi:hypothetical protein